MDILVLMTITLLSSHTLADNTAFTTTIPASIMENNTASDNRKAQLNIVERYNLRREWLVFGQSDGQPIVLNCSTSDRVPFSHLPGKEIPFQWTPNDALTNITSVAKRIVWIAPLELGYREFSPGNKDFGITVSDDGMQIIIDQSGFPQGFTLKGELHCAVLLQNLDENQQSGWYYLKWGFNLYGEEPSLNTGDTAVRYKEHILRAFFCSFFVIVFATLAIVVSYFKVSRTSPRGSAVGDLPVPINNVDDTTWQRTEIRLSYL